MTHRAVAVNNSRITLKREGRWGEIGRECSPLAARLAQFSSIPSYKEKKTARGARGFVITVDLAPGLL